jgi:hypothetical protein
VRVGKTIFLHYFGGEIIPKNCTSFLRQKLDKTINSQNKNDNYSSVIYQKLLTANHKILLVKLHFFMAFKKQFQTGSDTILQIENKKLK